MNKGWLDDAYDQSMVSVIIPVYNQERFLRACIQSAIDQTYRPVEIILVDDGSTDSSASIIRQFQQDRSEGVLVKCLVQRNLGPQHARNNGCLAARGEYFLFLDGDDLLSRDTLREQVELLSIDSQADVAYSDGQFLFDGLKGRFSKGSVLSIGKTRDFIASLLFGLSVPCFAYLLRRRTVAHGGAWDLSIPINQDGEYIIRLATMGFEFRYVAGIAGLYRKHSENTISEQTISLRGRTMLSVLSHAEQRLAAVGRFYENRRMALVDHYRRIARQVFAADRDCFEMALDAVVGLVPHYRPTRKRARMISRMIGFRNYERLAARIGTLYLKLRKYGLAL